MGSWDSAACGRIRAGQLLSLSYGRVAALHLANVERKPLFHFYPGEVMLSVGSLGCNFRCPGCQNRELAHADVPRELERLPYVPPQELVDQALREGLLGISCTHRELRDLETLETDVSTTSWSLPGHGCRGRLPSRG